MGVVVVPVLWRPAPTSGAVHRSGAAARCAGLVGGASSVVRRGVRVVQVRIDPAFPAAFLHPHHLPHHRGLMVFGCYLGPAVCLAAATVRLRCLITHDYVLHPGWARERFTQPGPLSGQGPLARIRPPGIIRNPGAAMTSFKSLDARRHASPFVSAERTIELAAATSKCSRSKSSPSLVRGHFGHLGRSR